MVVGNHSGLQSRLFYGIIKDIKQYGGAKLMEKPSYVKYIKSGLFYITAGILVLYIVIGIFMPNQVVKVFGFKPYVVITDSMEPYINVNDLIIVKNPKIDELKEEDIITFMADINYDGEKEVVTHYVYSITEISDGEFVFRTHPYFDEGVTVTPDYWVVGESDILGQYLFKIPKLFSSNSIALST